MDLGASSSHDDLPAIRDGLKALSAEHRFEALEACETVRRALGDDAGLAGPHPLIHLRLGKRADEAVRALDLGTDDPRVAHELGAAQPNRARHAQAAEPSWSPTA